jgi:hypothetical protein
MAGKCNFVLGAALILASISIPVCQGQMRGAGSPAHIGGGSWGFSRASSGSLGFGRSSFGPAFGRRFAYPRGYFVGGFPYLYDDYPYTQVAMPEAGPQVVLLQGPPVADAPAPPKMSPLLIELEGDRYVRHGGTAQSQAVLREPRLAPASTQDTSVRNKSAQLASTILIFRDGHRELIPDYAIVGRVLYAHGDSNGEPGYGVKSIQLSALDIPATIKANRENGIGFVLPSGPNEVVTRP